MGVLKLFTLFAMIVIASSRSLEEKRRERLSTMLGHKADKGHNSSKRSLWEFYKMVSCETGRSWMDFNGYGCWCGKGGGGRIVDDLDRCCYVHDNCYSEAQESGKCSSWNGEIYWNSYHMTGCSDCVKEKNSACEQALCECDRDAARCFAAHPWDPQYDDHPSSQC